MPCQRTEHRGCGVGADLGVQPLGECGEPRPEPGALEQGGGLGAADGSAGHAQVLQDGGGEDVGVLGGEADPPGDVVARRAQIGSNV